MRQIISSGSVKCISINKKEVLKKLKKVAEEAKKKFTEIEDIRLFGSLAKNQYTGLSDIDIFIITKSQERHPIKRMKPYFDFFSEELKIGIDILVATPDELDNYKNILNESFSLLNRQIKI